MSILVAGIGNVFRRDDGFGVEVVRRLEIAPGRARVVDFGLRGYDLALALSSGISAAIIVDTAKRGRPPGTLYVLEPEEMGAAGPYDTHGVHPLHAIALAKNLGGLPKTLRIVACEPEDLGSDDEPSEGLSAPVQGALDEAVRIVLSLVDKLEAGDA